MKYLPLLICALSLCFSCKTPSPSSNKSATDKSLGDSTQYAGMFAPWDGHWKGTFIVLSHPEGQLSGEEKPRFTSLADLQAMPLDTSLKIKVEQFYESSSPYYQSVRIIDRYEENGEIKTVNSSGYNVIRGDSILCVVNKPEETVIHQGEWVDKGVIIWARDISRPTKVEYFFETASDSTYTILGWGYYDGDDVSKSPKTYFFGKYEKQEED